MPTRAHGPRLAGTALLLVALAGAAPAVPPPPPEAIERAREAADALSGALMPRLAEELQAGGPARAIRVCSEIAQKTARDLSVNGLVVRRVTLRPRNTANAPDAWEVGTLQDMEMEHRREGRATERVEVMPDGQELRLMRPIVVGAACLACHGTPERLDPAVQRLLLERYPSDQAVGYREREFRGAVSVRLRLDPPPAER